MQQNMRGMDTEQGRETARRMDSHAEQVGTVVSSIGNMIRGLNWTGGDAGRFRDDWDGSFAPQASGAQESLSEHANSLRQHADAQDQCSA